MSVTGMHGVTENTPKNVPFGAGTIHRGLKYEGTKWNFETSLVGATNGGSKLDIVPELYRVPIDGVGVAVMGLESKVGEKATMEVNFAELTKDLILASTLGELGTSQDDLYELIKSKSDIKPNDYWENIAFVGRDLEGKNMIAILPNALCTSGMSHEGKNKESIVGKYTFECYADPAKGTFDSLPWEIYYPKAKATT
jgi:hypothetical protein